MQETQQDFIFLWMASQPAVTGLAIFAAGLVLGFQGFRFFRLALTATCFGAGWLGGYLLLDLLDVAPLIGSLLIGAVLGVVSVAWVRPSIPIASAATWAILGFYLGEQIGLMPAGALVSAALLGLLGGFFGWLMIDGMTVVLTTLEGCALMVLGFVGFASGLFPSVGSTFRLWAADTELLVPVLMVMLFTTSYSIQALQSRGSILTGQMHTRPVE